MNRRRSVDTLTLDEVRTRFENWRQNRCGKQPIPARRTGVNPTAIALHLDGGRLKQRMVAAKPVSSEAMPPTFVELMGLKSKPRIVEGPEGIAELGLFAAAR